MAKARTPKSDKTSRTGRNKKDRITRIDDVIISGDRLVAKVAWDLRDEQSEVLAYATAVDALTDQEDFTNDDVDALIDTLKSRFNPRRDEHALSLEQTTRIAEQFQYAPEQVEALSKELAIKLNPTKSPFVLHVPRQVSINRASAKLKDIRALTFKACDLLTQALEIAETLDTSQANDHDGAEKLNTLRREHEDATLLLEALYRKYSILGERPDCALDVSPEHRAWVADERRKKVLFCLFDFWAASGRPLTMTTDPKTNNPRKGPLYDFVNAVVVCLTVGGVALSGHTIFDDLKAYKAAQAQP